MAGIRSIEIKSVADFVEHIAKLRADWCGSTGGDGQLWFRGQPDRTLPLVPKLYRFADAKENEDDLRGEFQRYGSQLITESRPKDEWEWYFLMQHFGVPTRLLDWSDGGLLALYFAVRFHPRDSDPAVWVIEPCWLNKQTVDNDSVLLAGWPDTDPYLREAFDWTLRVKYPIAVDPSHVARRVTVQHSRFTIHGTSHFGLEEIASKSRRPKLLQFYFAGSLIDTIANDLNTSGIVETTVFPDLEGLGRELTFEYGGAPLTRAELHAAYARARKRWAVSRKRKSTK